MLSLAAAAIAKGKERGPHASGQHLLHSHTHTHVVHYVKDEEGGRSGGLRKTTTNTNLNLQKLQDEGALNVRLKTRSEQ